MSIFSNTLASHFPRRRMEFEPQTSAVPNGALPTSYAPIFEWDNGGTNLLFADDSFSPL